MKSLFKTLLVLSALMTGMAHAQLDWPASDENPPEDWCESFPCLSGCLALPSCFDKSTGDQEIFKPQATMTIDKGQIHYLQVSAVRTTYMTMDMVTGQVDLNTHSIKGVYHLRTFNDALKVLDSRWIKDIVTLSPSTDDSRDFVKAGCGSAVNNLIDALQDYQAVSDSGNQELIDAALDHVADMYSIFLDCHLQ